MVPIEHRPVRPAGAGPVLRPVEGPPAPADDDHLYAPRSVALLEGLGRLDDEPDPAACRDMAQWLREEYEAAHGVAPVGFLARCALGGPYVDHQLNLFHTTVEHYGPADLVPEPFSSARPVVRTGGCAFVEVRAGGLVLPVLRDGTVVRP
ncbi:hypothetical protein GCM10009716_42190 [Streptomyces sodiiphilus]|uniref:Uncharacterized protein n=1 Tax=Streptomyces sodiiphilus TaxID=226217 RepID=A0ABN2PRP1_9ACTN